MAGDATVSGILAAAGLQTRGKIGVGPPIRASRPLPAGGKLTENFDPYPGSLPYHLGLVTPNSDACRILNG